MMLDELRNALIKQIENAFSNIPYPGDDNITRQYHGGIFCDECAEIGQQFRGEHWRTITLVKLQKFKDTLPFFTPEAFRFFLPAYLLATLSYDEQELGVTAAFTLYSLCPPTTYEDQIALRDYYADRFRGFNKEQRLAIRDFVILYGSLYPSARHFEADYPKTERFWKRYCLQDK